jgi:hypothetical protein
MFGTNGKDNVAVSESFSIKVVDTTKGEILGLKAKYTGECHAVSTKRFSLPAGKCLDFTDPDPVTTWTPSTHGPFLKHVSQSEYTFKCTDSSGNVAKKVVGIQIVDTTPPMIAEAVALSADEAGVNVIQLEAWQDQGTMGYKTEYNLLRHHLLCDGRDDCGVFKCTDSCKKSNRAFSTSVHLNPHCHGEAYWASKGSFPNERRRELVKTVQTASILYTCTDRAGNTASKCVVLDIRAPNTRVPTKMPTKAPTKAPTKTPIRCKVSGWKDEPCTEKCGGGIIQYNRRIVSLPLHGGKSCPSLSKFESCNAHPCPIHCERTQTGWNACSSTCGGGTKMALYKIMKVAKHGGRECPYAKQTVCNTFKCPIDCVVSGE